MRWRGRSYAVAVSRVSRGKRPERYPGPSLKRVLSDGFSQAFRHVIHGFVVRLFTLQLSFLFSLFNGTNRCYVLFDFGVACSLGHCEKDEC